MRILIAEDDVANAKFLSKYLAYNCFHSEAHQVGK